MLVSLIAWTYVTLVCLIWGLLLLTPLSRKVRISLADMDSILICLAGLAGISATTVLLSLFIPLHFLAHLLILAPILYYCRKPDHRQIIWLQLRQFTQRLPIAGYALLAACILMVLVMSTYTILHPDTTGYHALAVLLAERYKVIPGIANVRVQFGFNTAWFTSLAIFSADTPKTFNWLFLNGTVLCWSFIFIIRKTAATANKIPWLLLLAFMLLCYTQVRLTATSASPDFIVALYTWAALYTFLQKTGDEARNTLYAAFVILFATTAVLLKLSALPLLILALALGIHALRTNRLSLIFPYFLMSMGMICTLFACSILLSGYPLFPFTQGNVFNVDWKMKLSATQNITHYITAFARGVAQPPYTTKEMSWLPGWWQGLETAYQLLLAGIVMGVLCYPIAPFFRRRLHQPSARPGSRFYIALITMLVGSMLWFINAPSPRFGAPWLLPFFYLLFAGWPVVQGRRTTTTLSWCMAILITGYTAYRGIHFFSPAQLLTPDGVTATAYRPIPCKGWQIDLTNNTLTPNDTSASVRGIQDFGNRPMPRGKTPAAGFRDGE